mmetsp:Transcript_74826/g.211454  ORF Transcript_74826/g.211454 Transcript_74826/m.211454 type:complete len:252 (+) Transcript_74826:685-1440(+)
MDFQVAGDGARPDPPHTRPGRALLRHRRGPAQRPEAPGLHAGGPRGPPAGPEPHPAREAVAPPPQPPPGRRGRRRLLRVGRRRAAPVGDPASRELAGGPPPPLFRRNEAAGGADAVRAALPGRGREVGLAVAHRGVVVDARVDPLLLRGRPDAAGPQGLLRARAAGAAHAPVHPRGPRDALRRGAQDSVGCGPQAGVGRAVEACLDGGVQAAAHGGRGHQESGHDATHGPEKRHGADRQTPRSPPLPLRRA